MISGEEESLRRSLIVDIEGNEDTLGARFKPVESSFLVNHHERHFRGRERSGDEHENRNGGDQKLS